MIGTTRTAIVLGALAATAQFGPAAAAVAAAADVSPDAVDKQNFAPKLSPQDLHFDQHKIDDDEKFSAPQKAPNDKQAKPYGDSDSERAAPAPPEEDSLASSGSKGSKILDDYDPNRLGVSADEAKSGKDATGGKVSVKKGDAKSDEQARKKGQQAAAPADKVPEAQHRQFSKAGYLEPKKSAPWAAAQVDVAAHSTSAAVAAYSRTSEDEKNYSPPAPILIPSAVRSFSADAAYSGAGAARSGAAAAHSGVAAAYSGAAAAYSGGAAAHSGAGAAYSGAAIVSQPTVSYKAVPLTSAVPLLPTAVAPGASTDADAKAQKLEADQLRETSTHIEEAKGGSPNTASSKETTGKDSTSRDSPSIDSPSKDTTSKDTTSKDTTSKDTTSKDTTSSSARTDSAKDRSAEEQAAEEAALASERSFGKLVGAALMIVTSEIGDKTFFIAALMAMKHPHLFVFSSSYSAMVVMTVLSMVLGLVLPSLLSKRVSTLLAALLFLVFGFRLLREGLHMDRSLAATDELEDVEHDLEMHDSTLASEKAEGGGTLRAQTTAGALKDYMAGLANLAALVFSPVWIQIFAMTFLGEWGDRSQIATVAMGSGSGWVEVLVGCLIGHFITTVIAVVGGKILAQHLSLRSITLSGAACFLLFAVIYFKDWLKQ